MNSISSNQHINPLYFLALLPHDGLRQEVKLFKEEISERFGASHALKSPAHITLQMPFRRPEEAEAEMIDKLKKFASNEKSFEVSLSGFNSFPPRVLFIRIVDHIPVSGLYDRLKNFLRTELEFKNNKSPFDFHPHMTIATRDLPEESFNRAWPEFEKREFEASFTVKSLFLLKHNGKDWDIYREYPFDC